MKKYLFSLLTTCVCSIQCSLQLTSPAFKHNGMIPEKYSCDGQNISPQLNWTGAPKNTKSFALLVEDPDAPAKVWVHWVIFNIPPTVHSLPENSVTGPFMSGATDFHGAQQYGGPCPPSGTHRYHFILFALDTTLDLLQQGASKDHFMEAIHNHVLAQTILIGKYQSKKH